MKIFKFLLVCTLFAASGPLRAAGTRIKEIVSLEGVRDNQLVGFEHWWWA